MAASSAHCVLPIAPLALWCPQPPSRSVCAMEPSDPVLSPVCYSRFADRSGLTAHRISRHGPARSDLVTHAARVRHGTPSSHVHDCPLLPHRMTSYGALCAQARLSAGPFRLKPARLSKACGFRRGRNAPAAAGPMAESQLSRCVLAKHSKHATHPAAWTETEDADSGSPRHQRCPEEGPII